MILIICVFNLILFSSCEGPIPQMLLIKKKPFQF